MARNDSSLFRSNRQCAIFIGGMLIGFVASSFLWLLSYVHFSSCSPLLSSANIVQQSTVLDDAGDKMRFDQLDSTDGWKQINVFYGSRSQISNASRIPDGYLAVNQWFSQYRQDEVVNKLLRGKRNGYFVDLASNDAIRISNTYALETFLDWDGLCLEPNPAYWSSLSYRACHVVAAVVGNTTMEEVRFRFPNEKAAKGGIIGNDFDNKAGTGRQEEARVLSTIRLADVFDRFKVPKVIDYLSLDVEGAEEFVMGTFPFNQYRFNILTLERPSQELATLLETQGYMLLKTLKYEHRNTPRETLWVHRSVEESLDKAALELDTQNYKYREKIPQPRIAPEENSR